MKIWEITEPGFYTAWFDTNINTISMDILEVRLLDRELMWNWIVIDNDTYPFMDCDVSHVRDSQFGPEVTKITRLAELLYA